MLWRFSGAPGQFPYQVLWSAMLSILLSYLKNVEYQQWLSLGHCQLLYEAILAEGGLGSALLRNGSLPLACPSLSSRLKAARFESTRLSPAKQPAGRLKMQRKGFRRAAVQW